MAPPTLNSFFPRALPRRPNLLNTFYDYLTCVFLFLPLAFSSSRRQKWVYPSISPFSFICFLSTSFKGRVEWNFSWNDPLARVIQVGPFCSCVCVRDKLSTNPACPTQTGATPFLLEPMTHGPVDAIEISPRLNNSFDPVSSYTTPFRVVGFRPSPPPLSLSFGSPRVPFCRACSIDRSQSHNMMRF